MLEVTNGKLETSPELVVIPDADGEAVEAVEAVEAGEAGEATAPRPEADISAGRALRALVSAPWRWVKTKGRMAAIVIVVGGLLAGLIVTDLKLRHQEALGSARTSALAAANTYSVELASYDYRHLDQDFGAVRQHSTPAFQASFGQSSSALESVLVKYHATASASVISAGVVSASTSRVVALVFLEQTVTNSTQKSGSQKDQSRVEMTLTRSHGHWLIDQVKLL